MFHWFGVITNTKGDSLPGWQVECVEWLDGSTVVPIYSDESLTPILTTSGISDRAVADASGNYDFFVAEGTYSLRFYDANGVFQRMQRYLPMYGNAPEAAIVAMEGAQAARDEAVAASELAQSTAGGTVYATWTDLAAATGMAAGDSAVVFEDAGTHTDPVTSATVNNTGIYIYSASPAGWERVADTEAVKAAAWAEGPGEPGGAGTKSAKEHATDAAASAVGFGQYVSVPTVSVNGRPFQPTHLQRGTLIAIQGVWLDMQNNQYDPNEVVVVPISSTLLNIYRKGDKPGSNYYIRQQFKLYNATGGTLQKGYVWRLGEQWECYRTGEFTFTDVRVIGNDVETDTAFQPYGGYTTNAGAQPAMPGGSFDGGALLIGGANHTGEYEYDGTLPAYSGFTPYALADGSPYTISASNPWRGTKFEFFHRTVGFLWNYSVVGSTVSKTSLSTTPAFDAYKRHVWSAEGYQLDQTVTWYADASSAPLRIRVAYSGMGLVYRREGGDTGTTNPFITNTGYFGPRFTPITLTTTGYSDQVAPVGSEFARLTGPTGIAFEWTDLSGGMRAFNSTGTLFFRDTNGRNKLYPDYANDDTPAANEVWAISNIQRLSTNN